MTRAVCFQKRRCVRQQLYLLQWFGILEFLAVKEKRFQLFEPAGRVLELPGTSLKCI